MRSEADTGARKKENVMHPTNNTSSVRALAVALADALFELAGLVPHAVEQAPPLPDPPLAARLP